MNDTSPRAAIANRAPLHETPLIPLGLGSVRASGWLANQLRLQAEGMTGHAETILPMLGPDSGWRGGSGEDWEKGPYYLRGLVSLAFLHDDATLREKVSVWVDAILAGQKPDGQLGPLTNLDWWPRMVICWALRDYHEATGDERIIPALLHYARYLGDHIEARPLHDWARARVADQIDTLFWLYNRTGESFLLEVADKLPPQGNHWIEFFNDLAVDETDARPTHAVNVSQAMKYPVVIAQRSGEQAHRDAFTRGYANLVAQHGLAFGMWSGTETLAGHADNQGVELCSMVEQILSNAMALKTLADPAIGDEQERIAFNLLAAGTTKDFRQHQYYSLPNMPFARTNPRGTLGFRDDHGDDLLVCPHSGFHCCCYNLHMGWPKYVQYAWMATQDGGLAAVAHGPTTVHARIGAASVTIAQQTNYPFEDTITFRVSTDVPASFPLLIRIPGWSKAPRVSINGEPAEQAAPGSFLRLMREWHNDDLVIMTLDPAVELRPGHNGAASIWRGPLVFSLRVEEEKREINHLEEGFDEFELWPASPWTYALAASSDTALSTVETRLKRMPENPWLPQTSPISLLASAKKLSNWELVSDGRLAGDVPKIPEGIGAVETVTLVPCGAQTLRITAFPLVGENPVVAIRSGG